MDPTQEPTGDPTQDPTQKPTKDPTQDPGPSPDPGPSGVLIPVTGVDLSFNWGFMLAQKLMFNLSFVFFGLAFVGTAVTRRK